MLIVYTEQSLQKGIDTCWDMLTIDFKEKGMSPSAIDKAFYMDLKVKLGELGRSLEEYGIEDPGGTLSEVDMEKAKWDKQKCMEDANRLREMMNGPRGEEQRQAIQIIEAKNSHCIFVDGRAGRGKTHLAKYLIQNERAKGNIALVCATSGLASLLYEGGYTAHSLFGLPIQEGPTGGIYHFYKLFFRNSVSVGSLMGCLDRLYRKHCYCN